ncbi:MAG: 1-acyl-sn-glycerol-3-phosphate acyltransferase [Pyrinomonadaceae bacterium]|nr:1-acyl-sn-glycerol-3-phosphate acyltransferase [Pyrinomonadaceae bacterium]
MITARKSRLFERIFEAYNRNLIARRFQGLRVAGLKHLTGERANMPLVIYANHSSWWDGLVAFAISRHSKLDSYAMMEEKQLRKYPFHRKIGAFSVVRENPREAVRSIRYASELLRNTNRAMWIFPQGATGPNDARPLKFYTGVGRIIEETGRAFAVPIAIRYEFLDDFKPEILARVGEPEFVESETRRVNAKELTSRFQTSLTGALDRIRADVLSSNFGDYEEIIRPHRRRSTMRSELLDSEQ